MASSKVISELAAEIDAAIPVLKILTEAIVEPKHSGGNRIRKRFRKKLSKYFRSIDIPLHELSVLYYEHVSIAAEAATPARRLPGEDDARDVVAKQLGLLTIVLHQILLGSLYDGYIEGSNQAFKLLGEVKLVVRPGDLRAARWAVEHGSKLVQGINETTRTKLARTIARGIEDKLGIHGLAREIRHKVLDMSRFRSETIARTETNNALSKARIDRFIERGAKFKRSVVGSDPCPICIENHAEGVIPIKQPFRSGHMQPAFHPNCVCTVVAVAASPIK